MTLILSFQKRDNPRQNKAGKNEKRREGEMRGGEQNKKIKSTGCGH